MNCKPLTLHPFLEEEDTMQKIGRSTGLLLVFVVGLFLAGCGQELKKENEQLKSQVASLQKENTDLKSDLMAMKGDNEAMKKQLDDMKQHMDRMQQKMKPAKSAKKK